MSAKTPPRTPITFSNHLPLGTGNQVPHTTRLIHKTP